MLLLVISCFSFILWSQLSFLNSFMIWKSEMRTLSLILIFWLKRSWISVGFLKVPIFLLSINNSLSSKIENVEVQKEISLLDLPDLALECILEQLSPAELSNMAGVCTSLRELCTSDHLWERHVQHKWGRLIGDVAYREWQWSIASKKRQTLLDFSKQKGILGYFSWNWLKLNSRGKLTSTLPVDSIMAWYLSLESGKFWFPGQVFNHEVGGMELLATRNHAMGANFIASVIADCDPDCYWSSSSTPLAHDGWRETIINRKDHREVGDETDGFYGGIRKIYNEDEISTWQRLWPT